MSLNLEMKVTRREGELIEAYSDKENGSIVVENPRRYLRERTRFYATREDLPTDQHEAIERFVLRNKDLVGLETTKFRKVRGVPCWVAFKMGAVYEAFKDYRYSELIYPVNESEGWKDPEMLEAYGAASALIRVKEIPETQSLVVN